MACTHIGCPEDMPKRTVDALKGADLLIFEEDKPARRFLKLAGLHRDYLKLNEHQSDQALQETRKALKSNKSVVYLSDQGSPTLADPGAPLLKIAYEVNAQVQVIPGPSSVSAAMAAWPFKVENYTFLGFLPRKRNLRLAALGNARTAKSPLVIMDTPYRLTALLEDCLASFGPKAEALIARDISGPKESFLFGNLKNLVADLSTPEKLNFVLIVKPGQGAPRQYATYRRMQVAPSIQCNFLLYYLLSVFGSR